MSPPSRLRGVRESNPTSRIVLGRSPLSSNHERRLTVHDSYDPNDPDDTLRVHAVSGDLTQTVTPEVQAYGG